MAEPQFQFEWDESKAAANVRKHGVSFELACTVFGDARLVTVADLEHGHREDRWFSIGCAGNGAFLSVVYLWFATQEVTKIRIISARKATAQETQEYRRNL